VRRIGYIAGGVSALALTSLAAVSMQDMCAERRRLEAEADNLVSVQIDCAQDLGGIAEHRFPMSPGEELRQLACTDEVIDTKDWSLDARNGRLREQDWQAFAVSKSAPEGVQKFANEDGVHLMTIGKTFRGRYGRLVEPAFVVRCSSERRTSVVWMLDEVLPDRDISVQVQLDSGPFRMVQMSVSSDQKSIGLWDQRDAISFLHDIEHAQYMKISIPQADGESLETDFSLERLSYLLPGVGTACRWHS